MNIVVNSRNYKSLKTMKIAKYIDLTKDQYFERIWEIVFAKLLGWPFFFCKSTDFIAVRLIYYSTMTCIFLLGLSSLE